MSCSYLGLKVDKRLIQSAQVTIEKLGVQFSAARTRINPKLAYDCDSILSKVFQAPTVTFATCGLVHLATLPLFRF